jgi:hypothetical protein
VVETTTKVVAEPGVVWMVTRGRLVSAVAAASGVEVRVEGLGGGRDLSSAVVEEVRGTGVG